MQLTSYGAVREVTGSMHLLSTGTDRLLLDCGMFQGRRKESDIKNRALQIDPGIITNIILSHAHIDHSGRIPFYTRHDFKGRVVATRATVDACQYMLRDSAHIQESDAEYLNYKSVRSFLYDIERTSQKREITNHEISGIKRKLKNGPHRINPEAVNSWLKKYRLHSVEPLYTITDAENALNCFEGVPYQTPVTVGNDITCTFYDAGHILGSAFTFIKAKEKGRVYRVLYSGDIGRFDRPIIQDPFTAFPSRDRKIDLLIMESTYGNRDHDDIKDLKGKLIEIIREACERGGSIIIPSFAFGRTQELIYLLHELYDQKEVEPLPIYIDSPLAVNLTRVFGEHPEVYDQLTHDNFLSVGKNPFMFDQVHFVHSVEESMELLVNPKPNIVISASGMCESGRILHHLRYKIHNPKNTILFVGYMAQNTLGRRILEAGLAYEKEHRQGPAPLMKFMDKIYPLHAHVRELGGFSAHADRQEMLHFLKESQLEIKKIALVHGEEDQIMPFKSLLQQNGFPNVVVPGVGENIQIK